jgi:rare lipoprotein A
LADRTGAERANRGGQIRAVLAVTLILSAITCARLPYAPKSGVEVGVASWYGQEFHGRPTSSREVFNMNDMTAAHRTLPFGTHVMVTNLENDRSVVVRINDRGPFIRGRIIDLSYAAARVLGLIGPGTARVRLENLGGFRETASESAVIWLQVGAFSVQENAFALKKRLEKTYQGVTVTPLETGSGIYYRVRVRADKNSADALVSRLTGDGFPVILIRE